MRTRPRSVPTPIADRVWLRVDKSGPVPEHDPTLGPCWLWTGALVDGYGAIYGALEGGTKKAHRVTYELSVGPIPPGLQLDHLCRVRHCVRPSHLEPVTQRENIYRGQAPPSINASKTHCDHGHLLAGDNLRIYRGCRYCKACRRIWTEADRRRKGQKERVLISNDQIVEIRRRLALGDNQYHIAADVGIHQATVSAVHLRKGRYA
jgi:HNH endonuclease